MSRRLVLMIPLALLTVGFGAGCGGTSDDSSKSDDAGVATAEFVRAADNDCAKANQKLQVAVAKALGGDKKPSEKQIILITEKTIVPGLKGQLKVLKGLTPPAAAINEFDVFVSAYSADIDELKKKPELAVSGVPMKNSTSAARNFGFTNCGNLGTS